MQVIRYDTRFPVSAFVHLPLAENRRIWENSRSDTDVFKESPDVLEPLSPRMTELLKTHGLCSVGDLRRCRRKVKRLTSDLPAFDSVWIDALVSQKSLTPYQATLLESDRPEQIAQGEYILIDRLGGRNRSETFLARTRKRKRFCLKKLSLRPEQREPTQNHLSETIRRLAEWHHPHVVAPLEVIAQEDSLFVVSRYVPGLNLRELLVRRGRFPVRVVVAIARQLLSGMRVLQKEGVYHGDLRLENVKLSPQGRALLVETGVQNAIAPQLSYVTDLTTEQCEGIAPERVATGNLVDERTELYSLGCLLWQLLAGRPPIKEADPLAKLTAHQKREIPDLREWAPDVPEKIALAVNQLTQRDPTKRPESFVDAAKLFGRSSFGDRRTLREYQAYFLSQAPGWTIRERSGPRKNWPWLVASAASLLMIAVVLQDEGARTELLSLANRVSETTEEIFAVPEPIVEEEETKQSPFLSLPAPDAEGVIRLTKSGEYLAEKLEVVGPLTIVAKEDVSASVIVRESWNISCESLALDNLQIQQQLEAEQGASVVVRSLDVKISHCTFDLRNSEADLPQSSPSQRIGIAWKSIDPEDRSGGRFDVRDSVFLGGGSQIYFGTSPSNWNVDNCLSIGAEAFARFRHWPEPERPLSGNWENLCLRQTGSMLIFDPKQNKSPVSGELRLTAKSCVFDLTPDRGALFLFRQEDVPEGQFSYLSLIGEDCVAAESLVVAGQWSEEKTVTRLPAERLQIEGLILAPIQYAGEISANTEDSAVREVSGPRLSSELPGIAVEGLPGKETRIPNSEP
ncbi:MAG: serine/threonine protein kinase [Planctomycetaceae bacterium]|nr:serine/threonine protein kinase [Planctomycetaceae bacterium]